MDRTEFQHYYLTMMGITCWVPRDSKPISSEAALVPTGLQDDVRESNELISTNLTIVNAENEENLVNFAHSEANPLSELAKEVSACTRCPLHQSRTNTVFSRGNSEAELMIIGEAPGFYEDKQGRPFVGKAGALLNQMLLSIGLNEETVYIANVLKCRPPNNRDPALEEINQCKPYLDEQIKLIKPKLILGLGRFAAQFLIKKILPLSQARQKMHTYQDIPCLISYHPAYLLRNPKDKKKAYIDLVQIKRLFEKGNFS